MTLDRPILMAVIGAPHGVRGDLRVRSFAADPLALGAFGPLHAADGRTFTVTAARPAGGAVVVSFREVRDRTAAEALGGTELFVDRSALPEGGEEDEYYHADLLGLQVRENGEAVGRVEALHDFGAGDILEISYRGRAGVMLPFSRAAVPEVDLAGGFVTIDPAAAGLIDDAAGRPASEGIAVSDDEAGSDNRETRDKQRRGGGPERRA